MSNIAFTPCNARIPLRHLCARKLLLILLLLWPVLLLACKREDPDELIGTSVTPMDHDPSDTFVRTAYINGRWVGSAGTGGSTVLDGPSFPRKWRPGLTAVVKWERCEPYGKNCRWTEKVVPVQEYDQVGRTWLHLMEKNEVLIISSSMAPSNPEYPGPGYPTKDFFAEKKGGRIDD